MKRTAYYLLFLLAALAAGCSSEVSLFNGENLDGWVSVLSEEVSEPVFTVEDGVISVSGAPKGYLRTEKKYGDYRLRVEWRWKGAGTNSGIFNRIQDPDKVWPEAVECQLKAGRAGDVVGLGGIRIEEIPYDPSVKFPVRKRNSGDKAIELPDGDWNKAEIVCRSGKVCIYVNGNLENEVTVPFADGYIAIQSEGGPLQFRNITLKEL